MFPLYDCVLLLSHNSQAIAACMATFVLDLLTANKGVGKIPNIMEQVQSFTKSDAALKKSAKKKKVRDYVAMLHYTSHWRSMLIMFVNYLLTCARAEQLASS